MEKEKIKKIVIADISESFEDKARDMGEQKLIEDQKDAGFFKRYFKYTLFREYLRQRRISAARSDLKKVALGQRSDDHLEKDHTAAVESVIERFQSEYDEMIHTDAGEKKDRLGKKPAEEKIKQDLADLFQSFASAQTMDDKLIQSFNEEKSRILNRISATRPDTTAKDQVFADNLLELAKDIRASDNHRKAIEDLVLNREIIIGRARAGVRTEAQYNRIDRIVDKLSRTHLGRLVKRSTLASSVALTASLASGIMQRVGRSKVAAWFTFGASAALGAGLNAGRESKILEDERRLHFRERAMNRTYEKDSKRREQMEKFRYEIAEAKTLIGNLKQALYQEYDFEQKGAGRKTKTLNEVELKNAFSKLADLESRIKLSDQKKIDLIGFSDERNVDKERFQMDLLRAQSKLDLKQILNDPQNQSMRNKIFGNKSFDEFLSQANDSVVQAKIKELSQDVKTKDKLFKRMKKRKVAWAGMKGLGIGLAAGAIAQEVGALYLEERQGLLGGNKYNARQNTALEQLRQWMSGETHYVSHGQLKQFPIAGGFVHLPDGMSLAKKPDGSFDLVTGNKTYAQKLTFGPQGELTPQTKQFLNQHRIGYSEKDNLITRTITQKTRLSAEEYAANSHEMKLVRRIGWYDNNTRISDLNELRLQGSGINHAKVLPNGDYQFSIRGMKPGGSFHGANHVDPMRSARSGSIKMLFSLTRDTQSKVFEIPFDQNGNAIIPKNSEAGRILFDSRGKFMGKYGEVAQVVGYGKDNAERVRIISTMVGRGIRTGQTEITRKIFENIHHVKFALPHATDWEMPPVIPLPISRTALEESKRPEIKPVPPQKPPVVPTTEPKSKPLTPEPPKQPASPENKTHPEVPEPEVPTPETSGELTEEILEERHMMRAAAWHTIHRLEESENFKYSDLDGNNPQEREEAFKRLTRELWNEFTVHGAPPQKEGDPWRRQTDLDGRACIFLLKQAGFNIDDANLNYVQQGRPSPTGSGVVFDTSDEHGVIAKDKGKMLIVDHHGKESGRDTSAAKFMYEMLTKLGLLKKTPALDDMISFITKEDNKEFTDPEIKNIVSHYHRNMAGLFKYLSEDQLLKFFEDQAKIKGKTKLNPYQACTNDYLKQFTFRKPVSGEAIELDDLVKNLREEKNRSLKAIESMEKRGLVIDTGDQRYGKILIDTGRRVNGSRFKSVGLGWEAVRSAGFGGYMIWMLDKNHFSVQTHKPIDFDFEQGFNVRGHWWLKVRSEKDELSVPLEEVLSKLQEKPDFQLDQKLRNALEEDMVQKIVNDFKDKPLAFIHNQIDLDSYLPFPMAEENIYKKLFRSHRMSDQNFEEAKSQGGNYFQEIARYRIRGKDTGFINSFKKADRAAYLGEAKSIVLPDLKTELAKNNLSEAEIKKIAKSYSLEIPDVISWALESIGMDQLERWAAEVAALPQEQQKAQRESIGFNILDEHQKLNTRPASAPAVAAPATTSPKPDRAKRPARVVQFPARSI